MQEMKLLRAKKAAEYMDISRTTFEALVRTHKELAPIYIRPKLPRWDKDVLDKWIERMKHHDKDNDGGTCR